MLKTRIIKPEFFKNDRLGECEPVVRLLYVGLWMMANRLGETQYDLSKIKSEIFPNTDIAIQPLIRQLEDHGLLVLKPFGGSFAIQLLHIGESFVIPKQSKSRIAIPRWIKEIVLKRDGQRCKYCGGHDGPFHLDHVMPVSKGGKNEPDNLTVACQRCNISKGAKLLNEWRPA